MACRPGAGWFDTSLKRKRRDFLRLRFRLVSNQPAPGIFSRPLCCSCLGPERPTAGLSSRKLEGDLQAIIEPSLHPIRKLADHFGDAALGHRGEEQATDD